MLKKELKKNAMEIFIIKLRVEGNYKDPNEENRAIGDQKEEADQENDGMFGVSILNFV